MPVKGLAHYNAATGEIAYLDPVHAVKLALLHPEEYGDPLAMVEALKGRDDSKWDMSMSELFGLGRLMLMRSMFAHYVDWKGVWPTIRGRWVHGMMENAPIEDLSGAVEVIREKRLYLDVPDPENPDQVIKVSGQLDVYWPPTADTPGTLVDYKTTGKAPSSAKESHILQANGYAVMVRRLLGLPVDRIFIVYLSYDQQKPVRVEVIDDETMYLAIQNTAWALHDWKTQRILPPRKDWCQPWEKYFCPFYDWCQKHPDWTQVPEGLVFAEGKVWDPEDWEAELRRRGQLNGHTQQPRAEWREEVG